jgi:RNA polymerase sigma factor for flagellar operon FliA
MLAEHYNDLVQRVATAFHAKLPACVEIGDLHATGAIGLMDAIAKYDPARNVKFETYAPRRIHGAMVDGLRDLDWVPRLVRQRKETVIGMGSLSAPAFEGDSRSAAVGDMLTADDEPTPSARLEDDDWMRWACRGLGDREQAAVRMYFEHGLTMREIGAALDLSESRISQMLTLARDHLRANLTEPAHA